MRRYTFEKRKNFVCISMHQFIPTFRLDMMNIIERKFATFEYHSLVLSIQLHSRKFRTQALLIMNDIRSGLCEREAIILIRL